jgi:hypothetical protein
MVLVFCVPILTHLRRMSTLSMSQRSPLVPDSYEAVLQTLKQRIRQAQLRAALAINQELILLYWQIGREILERQRVTTQALGLDKNSSRSLHVV